jgi:hypothetical protein
MILVLKRVEKWVFERPGRKCCSVNGRLGNTKGINDFGAETVGKWVFERP